MSSTDSKIAKIQKHFQTLSTAASSLNSASDELTKVIGKLDEALKKLNVGLIVWVTFTDQSQEDDPGHYNLEQIGYCRTNGKWGISLRHIWGHDVFERHDEDGPWHFTDAPREMRLRSVDKVPDLIEAMSSTASDTTKKIQEKTKEISELTAAIELTADEAKRKSLAEYNAVTLNALKANGIATAQMPPGLMPAKASDMLGDTKKGGK